MIKKKIKPDDVSGNRNIYPGKEKSRNIVTTGLKITSDMTTYKIELNNTIVKDAVCKIKRWLGNQRA